MDYRQYAKYFKPMNKIPLIISIVAAVVGAVLAAISIDTMAVGFILLVVGIIAAISIVTSRTKGEELDDYAERLLKKTLDTMLKKTEMDLKYVKMYPPIITGNYIYDGDVQIKEDTDGSIRSSKYQISGMLFSDNKVYIYKNLICFDSPDSEETCTEYRYANFKSADVEEFVRNANEPNINITNKTLTYYHMNIRMADGSTFVIPVNNDATTDETIKVLNRRFEQKNAPKENK